MSWKLTVARRGPAAKRTPLPPVVRGSGYRTQFIVVNSRDLTSGGRLLFYDQAGMPTRLLLRRP